MPGKQELPRGISRVRSRRGGREITLYQVRVTWEGRRELVGRFDTLTDLPTGQHQSGIRHKNGCSP